MPTLVSPGVSVTVTDESFFIPASAPTVPLFFVATADEKAQADGLTPAEGTYEYGVVRTVTSLRQSTQLYGIPRFLEDEGTGAPHHGDARNEYGVFALNQFLGLGNRAYVVRANVNLDDDFDSITALWDRKVLEAQVVLENLITAYLQEYNTTNNLIPSDPGYKISVTSTEYLALVDEATIDLFNSYSFVNVQDDYIVDKGSPGIPLDVYANGFNNPSTGTYEGLEYIATNITSYPGYPGGSPVAGEFTAAEGGDLLVATADDFKLTREFLNQTSLGANDAARRVAIVTALQAAIAGNTEIRSENFDYNLVLCPGFHETVDEMLALVADIQDEALVIADTPCDKTPDGITNPSSGWAASSNRRRSVHVAYYYPWTLSTNLDGKNVTAAASGTACRTYAYNDNVAYLWFAPAGVRRGVITGVANLGYVSGTLGMPTTFVESNLNQGQRDAMYQYAPGGDINPLVFFPGQGFLVWGQKTSAPAASAMDRVNVSRLVKYIKRQLRRNTLSYVFEPNDQLTRDNLKATVDSFLGDLVVKRGLYDFATVCDESNNTPDRIDRNEMYIDVAIKPVKAAEFIYVPIRIVATGTEI
jgi:phage tail sheath protein FI